MGHEHIRPTQRVAWCINVPTGTAKMEIPDYTGLQLSPDSVIVMLRAGGPTASG